MPDAPDKLISDAIKLEMADATSPETQIVFKVPARTDETERSRLDTTVQNFEIRGGPADATAYHDYYRLHIAFEHIWTELFDDQLGMQAQQLYQEYVRLKDFGDSASADPSISSIDELRQFMNQIRNQGVPGAPVPPPRNGRALGQSQQRMDNLALDLLRDLNVPGFSAPQGTGGAITIGPPPAASVAPEAQAPRNSLEQLLNDLDHLLSENKYAFDVFAPDSINFGVLVNYRQKWTPLNYQVGNLVSTIPLAPQEVRRYTTKTVAKKTRNVKEIDDSLHSRKQESSETSRADAEIVQKALTKTNFQITASESFGSDQSYKINAGQSVDQSQSKESAETKKEFHETVLKAAQEYRDQHRLEVTTDESSETETTTFREIKNPNDELTVTYLLYELQRTYDVSEKLHKLTPVVLVANDVPAPHEINDSWLITHDWILKRSILDDSFLPTLDYLTNSFTGAEVALQIQGINMQQQKQVVDRIGQQVKAQNAALQAAQANLDQAVANKAADEAIMSQGSFIKSFFDPLGITQSGKRDDSADKTMIDAAKDALDRAQNAARQLMTQLETEMTALQAATNKFAAAVQEHFNRLESIDRLRIHVKDNILYYMQAIWSNEFADQRYFRLYNLDVPIFNHHTDIELQEYSGQAAVLESPDRPKFVAKLPVPAIDYEFKKLNEVADLDNLLGFKGNYMIFPLKQFNYLTYFMMQDYIDVDQIVRAKDPDEFGNFTLDDLEDYMRKLFLRDPADFSAKQDEFKKLIIDYLSVKPNESDMVIVPTNSLYIEALPGTHPLLEDFKLIHRAVDVKKAQAETRHAELENIRLASRVLKGNDEDPNIDKKIVVEGGKDVDVSA